MRVKIYKSDEIETVKEFSNHRINSFYSILVYFLCAILFLFLVWSYFGKIDLKVKATGEIETTANSSIIVNSVLGKVKNSTLKQGKKVKKGDLLYEIENENLVIEQQTLMEDLKNKENLHNAMSDKPYNLDLMTSNFINKKNSHLAELATMDIEIEELKKTKNANYQILKIGGISRFEYEKSLNQLNISIKKRDQKAIEYDVTTKGEKITLETEIREIKLKLNTASNNIKNSKIVAPISGYVEINRTINDGDILTSDVNIAKIIPENSIYKVNIQIGENDIAKLKVGNNINYHLNYPDEKKNKVLKGKITLISKDAITRENGTKYYLVVGDINSNDVNRLNLKKGMSVESNVIYSRKSILNFLLEILEFKIQKLT